MASNEKGDGKKEGGGKKSDVPLFQVKKWNGVAMWSWDVVCDTCAICRLQVMGKSSVKVENL